MSQGTVFLPEPNPEDDREVVHIHERPAFVLQPPGFTFWYITFLFALVAGANVLLG
jgi:hypothetical protein